MPAEKWYQKTAVQAALVAGLLAGMFGTINLLLPELFSGDDHSAVVLEQTVLTVPGKQTFDDGQFSLELREAMSTETVEVLVRGPDGSQVQWRQGIGRKTYRHDSHEYLIDILSITNGEAVVTVSKRR